MPESMEIDLVARAQGGDVSAIGALYDEHHESIFRYVWLRVGDTQLAEDLTGDVFMRMLHSLPNYQSMGLPFRAWLYRIAHNRLVDHYRRNGRREPVSLDVVETHAADDDPLVSVERRLLAERLGHALSELDAHQREVVVLRFLAGLSLQETAAAMGRSEAAVKSLQHRSLAALRRALGEKEQVMG
jgi:RNA polymerase sigma-70 factor (ECF subfamily)